MSFLLRDLLLEPARISTLDNEALALALSQARGARLLASLAEELQDADAFEQLPAQARRHFLSGTLIHRKQQQDLAYDSTLIRDALNSIGEKTILLKGAAYLLSGLPAARGRLITDIDIIVPMDRIEVVESTLNKFGWVGGDINEYDNRYYRQWGHEIPPLTHAKRETTLDVHHNILPPTCEPKVNANLLFEELQEVKPGIFTLSDRDMVIHSATHLFHEGEFHHGLRDLWDLDRMLRDFPERHDNFWNDLVSRAKALDLTRSLSHALTYTARVYRTPIPDHVVQAVGSDYPKLSRPLMDFLFLRAFRPDHPRCRLPFTGAALSLLYIRSHYLRMPLYLLLPHLARKAWHRQINRESEDLTG